MLSDPAATAWAAAGSPTVDAPTAIDARCGRCGTDGPTIPSSYAVGEKFTAFDGWPYGLDRLCHTCAWAYARKPNTQPSLHITTTAVTEYVDTTQLLALLAAGPLPNDQAVIVPATRRQHILPTAQWAHLATDGFVIRWDAAAAQHLADIAWLRTLIDTAKSENATTWPRLSKPAPPPWLLNSQPAQQWPLILDAWQRLQHWRSLPQLWTVSRRLTNPRPLTKTLP